MSYVVHVTMTPKKRKQNKRQLVPAEYMSKGSSSTTTWKSLARRPRQRAMQRPK